MPYRHTQVGYWTIGATAALAAVVAVIAGSATLFALMCAIMAAAATLFGSLTTSINGGSLLVRFGPISLVRRQIAIADITAVRAVRNSPVYGWGMRYIPHGQLWNVWGLDAVELQLKNGTRFRIGTDEPAELVNALRKAGVTG